MKIKGGRTIQHNSLGGIVYESSAFSQHIVGKLVPRKNPSRQKS